MFAERHAILLQHVHVDARAVRGENDRVEIERELRLVGDLDAEDRERLTQVAERTPVTRALRTGIDIRTVTLTTSCEVTQACRCRSPRRLVSRRQLWACCPPETGRPEPRRCSAICNGPGACPMAAVRSVCPSPFSWLRVVGPSS